MQALQDLLHMKTVCTFRYECKIKPLKATLVLSNYGEKELVTPDVSILRQFSKHS